jgi:hypothetical protein
MSCSEDVQTAELAWVVRSVCPRSGPSAVEAAQGRVVAKLENSLRRWWSWFEARDDAFDALVACLVAAPAPVPSAIPSPSEHVGVAEAEGWIALPKKNSLPDLAVN